MSIIVPVYNTETYLKKCIESILNQTYKNIEIVLVTDGSTDTSGEICDDFAKHDARIKVIHKKNSGVVDARKIGVQHATGDYCTCIDSDDWISNIYVEKMIDIVVDKTPDIICCGIARVIDTQTNEIPLNFKEGYYLREKIISDIIPWAFSYKKEKAFPINTVAKVYTTNLCRKILAIPESGMVFSEDFCSIVVGLYKCNSLYITKECLYYYRYNPNSVCNGKNQALGHSFVDRKNT